MTDRGFLQKTGRITAEEDTASNTVLVGIVLICWTVSVLDGTVERTADFFLPVLNQERSRSCAFCLVP